MHRTLRAHSCVRDGRPFFLPSSHQVGHARKGFNAAAVIFVVAGRAFTRTFLRPKRSRDPAGLAGTTFVRSTTMSGILHWPFSSSLLATVVNNPATTFFTHSGEAPHTLATSSANGVAGGRASSLFFLADTRPLTRTGIVARKGEFEPKKQELCTTDEQPCNKPMCLPGWTACCSSCPCFFHVPNGPAALCTSPLTRRHYAPVQPCDQSQLSPYQRPLSPCVCRAWL